MNNLIELYKKYKMPILYILFGAFTTLMNMIVYFVCYDISHLSNGLSTIIAWLIAVLLAFITNKKYVFESTSNSIWYELSTFFVCRIGTGLLDLIIMIITVDYLHWHALLMKVLSNIIVILLNYLFSKIIIFKK